MNEEACRTFDSRAVEGSELGPREGRRAREGEEGEGGRTIELRCRAPRGTRRASEQAGGRGRVVGGRRGRGRRNEINYDPRLVG